MDYILPEILAGELVPVLLGFSVQTLDLAKRIYRKYGVVSHVFCQKLPLTCRLAGGIHMKFHFVPQTKDERLMQQALLDFADQLAQADVIPYLIPCTEEYAGLLWQTGNVLESRYVLAGLNEDGVVRTEEKTAREEKRI